MDRLVVMDQRRTRDVRRDEPVVLAKAQGRGYVRHECADGDEELKG